MLGHLMLGRAVDNYLSYLSDLLALLFTERPETLRSREKVDLEFVLQWETMAELQDALAERRVENLAYKGMDDLAEYVSRTLNFELFQSPQLRAEVRHTVERRNLIVHKRGVIDRRYVQRVGEADGKPGQPLDLGGSQTLDAISGLCIAVADIDDRASEKWSLSRGQDRPLTADEHDASASEKPS